LNFFLSAALHQAVWAVSEIRLKSLKLDIPFILEKNTIFEKLLPVSLQLQPQFPLVYQQRLVYQIVGQCPFGFSGQTWKIPRL
jgi:hypothetical protein